ncbi:hypothetical protein F2Q70_00001904 [Brassica cretica]|uniref:Glutaredoxin domain-containing protein n=1 Tax=Brassica cretica TaxID=69181 RepID=A0A8S9IQC8_BRACR|nr:hypothetical protein F2Q70_00001904 [Brassica cretica]
MDKVMRMSSEKGVVIFTKDSCCLCYAVQILFRDLRVQPTIHEIDNDPDCREIEKALVRLGCTNAVPAREESQMNRGERQLAPEIGCEYSSPITLSKLHGRCKKSEVEELMYPRYRF